MPSFSAPPSGPSGRPGASGSFTVTALDPYGLVVPGYQGTVHLTSSDAAAVLPGNATLSNGVGTFAATLNTRGTQSLIAADTVVAALTGSQTGIVVQGTPAADPVPGSRGVAIGVSDEPGRLVAPGSLGLSPPGSTSQPASPAP